MQRAYSFPVLIGLLVTFTVCMTAPIDVAASEKTTVGTRVPIETFTPPKRETAKVPSYPRARQARGQEGWVRMNFMIDPTGKPYDITVVSSSNDAAFETKAVSSVEQWMYRPAMLDGKPIDAGTEVMITFELEGGKPGASARFVKRYKRFMKSIGENDLQRAKTQLTELEEMSRNLYEEAYFHLARFNYYQNTNAGVGELYDAIIRAAAMDQNRGFLPENLLTSVLSTKLSLELKQNKLADAQATATVLQAREVSEKQAAYLTSVTDRISQIKASNKAFAINDVLRGDNNGVQSLLHNQFALTNVAGDIAELRLHCDRGYIGFIFDPDITYRVRDDWQECKLILIGNPQTTYTLVQGKP
jgi:TonB family protein